MPVIKRYPNRKLYDTAAKRYVTLDEIARLIRAGQEVTVIDHASGEDLTAVTLSQVILEQERKREGFVPQAVLAGLVRAGGETVSTLRRTLAAPLNLARQVDEEIERRLSALVRQGELPAEEEGRWRDRLVGALPRPPDDEALGRLLEARELASQDDVQRLLDDLDRLAAQIDEVRSESQGRP
ncbi:MAG: polyhydroxyalkanoate synthesis regulator DNA-binding domain-containing protein [Anaerolineae bacterium]